MLKKAAFFFILNLVIITSFAQTLDYRLTRDVILESLEDSPKEFKKGTVLKCNKNELEFYINNEETKDYRLLILPLYTDSYSNLVSYDKELELFESIKIFSNNYINIVPVYYLDVLKKKDASLIFKYKPEWYSYKKKYKTLEGESFEEAFWPEPIQISNLYITFGEYNHYLIEKISLKSEYYTLDLYKQDDEFFDKFPFSDNYVKNAHKKEITIVIKFDGDYVDIWIDSPKKENLIGNFFLEKDMKTVCAIGDLITNGTCDLTKVYWPRHADGTSDYDNKILEPLIKLIEYPSDKKTISLSSFTSKSEKTIQPADSSATNVSVNKTMSVSENLKLRSGEATSTQVLTVMAAGTKVKILELGKAETIDGITSNWVKVEVQAGAKDRDGKSIKAGTVGWCYGGYLK